MQTAYTAVLMHMVNARKDLDMRCAVIAMIMACTWLTMAECQLPCNSPLRQFPSLSHLFLHCNCQNQETVDPHCVCTRSDWTEWTLVRSMDASTETCPSGKSILEERRQRVLTGFTLDGCQDTIEQRTICEPTEVEKIILALGLGSSGHHISPPSCIVGRSAPDIFFNTSCITRFSRQSTVQCEKTRVCQSHTTPPRPGKRAVRNRMKPTNIQRDPVLPEVLPTSTNTIPFDIFEHGARYRRQPRNCEPDGIKYILFVLDTSGSISIRDFDRMKNELSCLVPLFCDPIKFAVMTFDHNYYLEFCFDCYDGNTCADRISAANAIRDIRHRRGWTHTGGAVRCICEDILHMDSELCGIDYDVNNCIEVVFITDGRSNDPRLDVCHEIGCLHTDTRVKTHVMGIGNFNNDETDCISNNASSYFFFDTFDTFETQLSAVVDLLTLSNNSTAGDGNYTCATTTDNPVIPPVNNNAEWCGLGFCTP